MGVCSTVRNILATIGVGLVYMSFGIAFTPGNINPYLIPFMGLTSGETIWFSPTIEALQAIGAILGSFIAAKIGVLLVTLVGCFLLR